MTYLPWWLIQPLWLVTELFLLLVLVVAAIVQRRHLGVAVSLGVAAACCGWFAIQAVASLWLLDAGLLGGSEPTMLLGWLLQALSRVAGVVMWVALGVAVLLPRRVIPERSGDPFAEG